MIKICEIMVIGLIVFASYDGMTSFNEVQQKNKWN